MIIIFYIKICFGNGVVFEMIIFLLSKKVIDEIKYVFLKGYSQLYVGNFICLLNDFV